MANFKYIEIEGERYLWRDIVQLRRERKNAHAEAGQPVLFELKDDTRPVAERTLRGATGSIPVFYVTADSCPILPCRQAVSFLLPPECEAAST